MVVVGAVSLIGFFVFVLWFNSLFEEPEAKNTESLNDMFPIKSILVVLAHPDDEIFVAGMLVKLKLKPDVNIKLICATGGEGGFRPRKVSGTEMIKIRQDELLSHCRLLGIDDQELLRYQDGKLIDSYSFLLEDIVRAIRSTKPDMLLTFDPECGYTLHPDHLAVGRAVTEAVSCAVDPGYEAALGDPFQARWLAYCIVPKKIMRYFGGPRGEIIAKNQRPAQYAIKIDKMIKVRGWLTHKSQSWYLWKVWKIPSRVLYTFFDKEHYVVTEAGAPKSP